MTMPPPIVTGDLAARTRELAERYSPWRSGRGDFGNGLVDVFARLAEIVAARINTVPDKNFLAFLDLVGVRLLSPRPARVPLTFELAAGTSAPVLVPAGTTVAATPAEGESTPPAFETQRPLLATPVQLQSVVSVDADRDRYSDNTAAAAPDDEQSFDVFAGREPLGHALFIADERLGITARKHFDVAIGLRDDGKPWPSTLEWAYWDGLQWAPLVPSPPHPEDDAPSFAGDGWRVTFEDLPPVEPTSVAGRTGRFLRAVLPTPLPRPQAGAVPGTIAESDLGVDAAFADEERLDFDDPEVPFDTLGPGSVFLVASADAFSKPGANVRLSIALDPTQPAAPADVRLAWKYATAVGWAELSAAAHGFEDTTYAFARDGEVRFRAPAGWISTNENGIDGWWLKAEIVSGSYELSQPPFVVSVGVSYDWTLPETRGFEARARIEDADLLPELAFANQAPIDLNKDFFPFGEKPALNDTLYLAAEAAFGYPGAYVVLDVALTNESDAQGTPKPARPSPDLVVRWEYWDTASERWEELGSSGPGVDGGGAGLVADGTAAFTSAGPVVFWSPATMGPVTVNGELRHWLRARIASGNYGVEAHYRDTGDGAFELVLADFQPPSIRSLRIAYQRPAWWAPLYAVVAENAFAPADVTEAARPDTGELLRPFVPGEDETSAVYLGFDRPFPDVFVTLYLGVVEPLYSPRFLRAPTAEPPAVVWEYWNGDARSWHHLQAEDETNALTRRGLVSFVGPPSHEPTRRFGLERWWLRARSAGGTYVRRPRLAHVLTNTTWAAHVTAVRDEALGSGTGERGQTLRFVQAPVLEGQRLEVRELEQPRDEEVADLGADPVRTVRDATGRLLEVWVRWREVVDFYSSGPRSRHYVLDRLTGEIRFGDGVRGLPPPQGRDNVVARSYRTGGGVAGNRPAHTITGLTTTIPSVAGATNHEPAAGGSSAETLEQARERGPRTLRHGDRAVVIADFEDLALSASPAVARVRAVPVRTQEDRGRVLVVIVPRSQEARPAPSVELLNHVGDYLRSRSAPAFDLHVVGPGWVRVDVAAEVVPRSLEQAADVESAIRARLAQFLHPLHGGVDGGGWPFGRRPHRSDLYAVIEAVEGVDHVRALDVDESTVELPVVAEAFLAYSGEHDIAMAGGD